MALVRLVKPTDKLLICEGVETALAVLQAVDLPTWATISASNFGELKIPEDVKEIRIFGDLDRNSAGQKAAEKLAARLARGGHSVFVHLPEASLLDKNPVTDKVDWLDILNTEGPSPIAKSLADAKPYVPSPTQSDRKAATTVAQGFLSQNQRRSFPNGEAALVSN